MPFTMQCTNKGCGQIQSPYLDPKTDKVYCSLCDKELTQVTHFAKVQMKSLKQYKEKKGKSFSVKCTNCNNEDRPQVNKDKYFCSSCKKELNVSHAFKLILQHYLGKAEQDI
jgi:hypothetical protein